MHNLHDAIIAKINHQIANENIQKVTGHIGFDNVTPEDEGNIDDMKDDHENESFLGLDFPMTSLVLVPRLKKSFNRFKYSMSMYICSL